MTIVPPPLGAVQPLLPVAVPLPAPPPLSLLPLLHAARATISAQNAAVLRPLQVFRFTAFSRRIRGMRYPTRDSTVNPGDLVLTRGQVTEPAVKAHNSQQRRRREQTGLISTHGHGVHGSGHHPHSRRELSWLSLGALGVVYGDIGTSPLYAMRECFTKTNPHRVDIESGYWMFGHGAPKLQTVIEADNILGILSLFVWTLILVVILKYLVFVLRADNKGEGGTLALAALVAQKQPAKSRTRLAIPILLALFGTGLLFGEGIITPAISVMSAVEGIKEQSPSFARLVVPISAGILIGLFWVQRYG